MAEGGGPAHEGGQLPAAAPQQIMHMNWSHFKPKFLVAWMKMWKHIY